MANENDVVPAAGTVGHLTALSSAPTAGIATINVSIVTAKSIYALAVGIPTVAGGPYSFNLTDTPTKGTPSTLADFEFKDESNYKVSVNMPTMGTDPSVTAGFNLVQGTPGS